MNMCVYVHIYFVIQFTGVGGLQEMRCIVFSVHKSGGGREDLGIVD